jgi:hypothetical protein
MSKFSSIVRTSVLGSVLVLVGGLGGCANSGGAVSTTSFGVTTTKMLTDPDGGQHRADTLDGPWGEYTLDDGRQVVVFTKKKDFWDRAGDVLLDSAVSTGGAFAGAHAGKAIGGGPIATSTGAVGVSTAARGVADGIKGNDPRRVLILKSSLAQPASLATAK